MTFQEAINNIASSIKQEEDSLSELLKQEAAKIQKFIDEGASAEDLLKVNNSVTDTVQEIKKLEDVLKEKLNINLKMQAYQYHLGKLCSKERGEILEKIEISTKQARYKFSNPLFKGFLLLKHFENSNGS